MTVERPLPPPLEPRAPDCSICGKEVGHEDGWVCYDCGASWPDDHHGYDEPGEWYDGPEPRCDSILRPFEKWPPDERHERMRWYQYRCLLTENHGGEHRHPDYIGSWSDKQASEPDARAIPDPYGEEHYSIMVDRRRTFETRPPVLSGVPEETPPRLPVNPAANAEVRYRPIQELDKATVVDVHLPD